MHLHFQKENTELALDGKVTRLWRGKLQISYVQDV